MVLTARDEKRGLEAVEKLLKESGLIHDLVVFHQLDVVDPASVASLEEFVKTQFGKLDILVSTLHIFTNPCQEKEKKKKVLISISIPYILYNIYLFILKE